MTSSDDLRLAELLCARLCHDLSGPVGAAAAGAELFEDVDAGADAETLALVAASAAAAAQRLKFFRAAFGPATATAQPMAAWRDLTDAYLKTVVSAASSGIGLDWHSDAPTLDGETARLALNLVLIAKDALPRGGRITVATAGRGVRVTASGQPAALADEAGAALQGGSPPPGPRGAHAAFTRAIAGRCGLSIAAIAEADGVALTAAPGPARTDDGLPLSDG